MPAPTDDQAIREQLRATLRATGLEASDARVEQLLPAYQGIMSGAARLRSLDLGETEPAIIFRLPAPEQ